MIPPICNIGSPSCGDLENCYCMEATATVTASGLTACLRYLLTKWHQFRVPQKLKFRQFFAKGSWSVLDDRVTETADITGFGSTVGYNATPYYRLLGSLHVIEIFKKPAAENRDEILLIMIPPSVKHRFSKMRGREELLFFQLVVVLHRSKRHSNSFWAHRMFEKYSQSELNFDSLKN